MTGVCFLQVMSVELDNSFDWSEPGEGPPAVTIAPRPRLRDRVAARWRARRLDRALAGGTATESSPALALRARRLSDYARRRSIAQTLTRVVDEAENGGGSRSTIRVVPSRARVLAAAGELRQLAELLGRPGPVDPHGVAHAWILVTDGTGPLYGPSSAGSLTISTAAAIRELQLQTGE